MCDCFVSLTLRRADVGVFRVFVSWDTVRNSKYSQCDKWRMSVAGPTGT